MEDELLREQLKWIAAKVDKMDAKLDRLTERFNLSVGKILGASAVISVVAAMFIELMRK